MPPPTVIPAQAGIQNPGKSATFGEAGWSNHPQRGASPWPSPSGRGLGEGESPKSANPGTKRNGPGGSGSRSS